MRPLLFHRLLSQHPTRSVPTPESSSRLFSGSLPLLLPSWRLGAIRLSLAPLSGLTCRCCKPVLSLSKGFTLCYGLLLCFPFSGSYNASTQSVTRLHRLPAIRRPDPYRNWTRFATSEQTMTFQDTPRGVRRRLYSGWSSWYMALNQPWYCSSLTLTATETKMQPKNTFFRSATSHLLQFFGIPIPLYRDL